MGSYFEINDTLQITKEQGFPTDELDLERHLKNEYTEKDFEGKIFEFYDKPNIRNYQMPPVRNFLVENKNGKWIYWGLIHILEVTHNYEKKTTSGKFKIIHINNIEQMKMSHNIIDRNKNTDFFSNI